MQFFSVKTHPRIHPDLKQELEVNAHGMKLHPDARYKKTIDKFKTLWDDFNKIHNYVYDYSLVVYRSLVDFVKIICPKHGIFEMSPESHLGGGTCPECFPNCKVYQDKDTILYLVYLVETGYYKVGITLYDVETRFRYEDVEYHIVKIWSFPKLGHLAYEAEQRIKLKTNVFQIDESKKIFKRTKNTEVRNKNILTECETEVKKILI